MDHWISRHILKRLLTGDALRWSELRPDGESDNLFGYYMKRLTAMGLIANHDKLWSLTDKGRSHLSDLSLDTMRETKMPKLCVMIGAISDDMVAVYRWNRAPHTGKVTVPYGRWHRGDTQDEAYQRELREKYGFDQVTRVFAQRRAYSVDVGDVHEVHIPCVITVDEAQVYGTEKGMLVWVSRRELDDLPWATSDHRAVALELYGEMHHDWQ